jgi:hypothetical protein
MLIEPLCDVRQDFLESDINKSLEAIAAGLSPRGAARTGRLGVGPSR